MDPHRLDLSAIDPLADPERHERLVRTITQRARPVLARRAAESSPIALLASWARPMLATAAVLVILSTTVLTQTRDARGSFVPDAVIVDALHIPDPVAEWLTEDRSPTVGDLILVMEGDGP